MIDGELIYHYGNSSFYHLYMKKMRIIRIYLTLWGRMFPKKPTYMKIAQEEWISMNTAKNTSSSTTKMDV